MEHAIWQEDYWQQMLTDFKQLKLYDFVWLEPIKDVICQAECILQQILYPGINSTSEKPTRRGAHHQPPDMLDEVLNKLRNIDHSSKKLIQLYRPFVQDTNFLEIAEEESGTFVRLINRSDQLETVLSLLEEKVNNMKKLSAKDVKLDVLLHNFREVTKDRRLLHAQRTAEVMRHMAEMIYDCKNGIGLLCLETGLSNMVEFDTSKLQQGYRRHRYYIRTIDGLIYLADQLAIVLAKVKCSRDHLFDNEFPCDLLGITKTEKEAAANFDPFKSHSPEQHHNSRLKVFLKDTKALRQSYKHWKELRRQKYMTHTFPEEYSTDGTIGFEFDPEYALDAVLQWDPFNSMSCIGHAEVSVRIFSIEESAESLSINGLQTNAKSVSQIAISRLTDLFDCLINANAAFHNDEVIQAYSYAWHPSRYFCTSSDASSSSRERYSSGLSSLPSSHSTGVSSHPIDIPAPKISQNRPTCEIEPTYEKEKESDGRVFFLFSEAISNLKQLAYTLIHKKCGYVLSKSFREAFESAMEQKLVLLGFHNGVSEELDKLGSMEASALRERRRDWEMAFKVIVHELLPWPKFLCDEIFSDNNSELMEVCFYEYAKLCLKPLLNFADAAASVMSNRAERIFHQLYVHEVLSELSANISTLFSGLVVQESEPTRLSFAGEVTAVLKRLENAILKSLVDFRSQIQYDKSCIEQNEVDVHHLTRSTMSYVKQLSHHRITINSVLHGEISFSSRKSLFLSDQRSSYDCREFMLLLFSCLQTKLAQKSHHLFGSVAKRVFWINNLGYMIEQVGSPQLRIIFGEKWVQEQNNRIQGYLTSYEALVLAEIQSSLAKLRGNTEKKLKSFKSSIEDVVKVRASWKVPNPIWRSTLRNAALDVVVSVYTDFWYRLNPALLDNNILKISMQEELESLKSRILDLFEG